MTGLLRTLVAAAGILGLLAARGSGQAPPVSVPEKQWVVLPLPAADKGISHMDKHVTLAFTPFNNRIYLTGGDYYGKSYRQETWSLDMAERLASTDPAAGWRLEYPYCGPKGAPQPKGPDHVGFTWDPTRNLFWMVPGEMAPHGQYADRCPGERPDSYGDEDGSQGPQLIFKQIMTFDPKTKTWAHYDSNANGRGTDTWYSVYDPVTDTIIRPSPNYTMGIYDIKAKRWTNIPLGVSAEIQQVMYATDYEKRRIFIVDPRHGRLFRWNMDARTLSDIGPIPNGPISEGSSILSDKGYCVWDSNAKVLIHYRFNRKGVFVYHPDETPPRWEATNFPLAPGAPPGQPVHWNGAAFDPVNNVMVGIGGEGSDWIWVLRYSASPAQR